ncbi:MAG: radical SAM-associated putative lipoprotein [Tannerella sp.]|nr:radical SAM-associated putative lipoprotein [Tannerella sp.]
MKNLYRPLIKGTNWALAGILTVLGFNSCDIFNSEEPVEYGSPNADYTVKGKVVNKANGKAIKGIKVEYTSPVVPEYGAPSTSYQYLEKSVVTDDNGNFKLTANDFPGVIASQPVYISDIDGEANGSFADTTVVVDFKTAEQTKKGSNWYSGEYTVNLDVELREISKDE